EKTLLVDGGICTEIAPAVWLCTVVVSAMLRPRPLRCVARDPGLTSIPVGSGGQSGGKTPTGHWSFWYLGQPEPAVTKSPNRAPRHCTRQNEATRSGCWECTPHCHSSK